MSGVMSEVKVAVSGGKASQLCLTEKYEVNIRLKNQVDIPRHKGHLYYIL